MDYLKMLKEIDSLIFTGFIGEMENKLMPDSEPYTQEESKKMAELLTKVFKIAHSIHCKSCGKEYIK